MHRCDQVVYSDDGEAWEVQKAAHHRCHGLYRRSEQQKWKDDRELQFSLTFIQDGIREEEVDCGK